MIKALLVAEKILGPKYTRRVNSNYDIAHRGCTHTKKAMFQSTKKSKPGRIIAAAFSNK